MDVRSTLRMGAPWLVSLVTAFGVFGCKVDEAAKQPASGESDSEPAVAALPESPEEPVATAEAEADDDGVRVPTPLVVRRRKLQADKTDDVLEDRAKDDPAPPPPGKKNAPKASAGLGLQGAENEATPLAASASGSSLDPAEVERVVQENVASLQDCYEEQAAGATSASRAVLVMSINGAGIVTASSAEQSELSAQLEDCVVEASREWAFPPTTGGGTVRVKYPLVFQPQ